MNKIILNKALILESASEQEKLLTKKQNFVNGIDPKDEANERFQMAAINANVVTPEMKLKSIAANHKASLVGHHSKLDADKNGVDIQDLKDLALRQKGL